MVTKLCFDPSLPSFRHGDGDGHVNSKKFLVGEKVCDAVNRDCPHRQKGLSSEKSKFSFKDMFDRGHNPSHLTLYPDVLKIKTIIAVNQNL